MCVKLLTEHPLEFLSLKGGYRGSSESKHCKMPHCWKSHVTADMHLSWKKNSVHGIQQNWRPRKKSINKVELSKIWLLGDGMVGLLNNS